MRGSKTEIWLLYEGEDDCQPLEYIKRVDRRIRNKINTLLERISNHGSSRDERKFKHLDGFIYEFKPYGTRLLCCQTDRGFVIVRAHGKSKDKVTQRELKKAKILVKAFLEGGEYYDEQT